MQTRGRLSEGLPLSGREQLSAMHPFSLLKLRGNVLLCSIAGAGAQALWICSLQSLGGAEDRSLSSPNPSDETAQALKDTVGSSAGLPGWDRVGREDKMSLSCQVPVEEKPAL